MFSLATESYAIYLASLICLFVCSMHMVQIKVNAAVAFSSPCKLLLCCNELHRLSLQPFAFAINAFVRPLLMFDSIK